MPSDDLDTIERPDLAPPDLSPEPEPRIIYLGRDCQYEAIVDEEDYHYLVRWSWSFKISSSKYSRRIYARRTTWTGSSKDGTRRRLTIFMHDAVLNRKGEFRPDPTATADHKNRKSLDNRRDNLRYASKSLQSTNQRKRRRKP